MQRRKFISLSTLPALGAMLAACGGASTDGGDNVLLPGETEDSIIEEGVHPSELSRTPEPIRIDFAYLQEEVRGQIRASVVLGTEAQVGVPVTFYDALGNVLGTGITNDEGIAITQLPARRLVAAEAHTSSGRLYGMRFYSGDELIPTIYIDVLQSILVNVVVQLVDQYNVSMYVLQDYFRVSSNTNLLNVGHFESSVDQRMVYAEWKKSGLQLDRYIDDMAKDIIDHVDDDGYYNLRFNSNFNSDGVLKKSYQKIEMEDIVKYAGQIGISAIAKAIPIPFASDILKFAFSQFTSAIYPAAPSPFVEVRERLQEIDAKISRIEKLIIESDWKKSKQNIADEFTDFVNVKQRMNDLEVFKKTNPQNIENSLQYKQYKEALLKLSEDGAAQDKLRNAVRKFLGREHYYPAIDDLLATLKEKKFFSKNSEYIYRGYLAYFLCYQSLGYALLASSYTVRYFEQKDESKADREERTRAILRDLERELLKLNDDIARIDTKKMPERVNIDHINGTAWIGSCGIISKIVDFWPPGRKAPVERYMYQTNGRYYYDSTEENYGRGMDGWGGPVPLIELRRSNAFVNEETIKFSDWRSPTEKEFKDSFHTNAKYIGKKIDVCAYGNGFSCTSESSKAEIKAFSFFPLPSSQDITLLLPHYIRSDELAQIPTQYRRAGRAGSGGSNYYLDCTQFDLKNNGIYSRNVRNFYLGSGQNAYKFIFFPVCSLTEKNLIEYIPWLHVEAARSKYPL